MRITLHKCEQGTANLIMNELGYREGKSDGQVCKKGEETGSVNPSSWVRGKDHECDGQNFDPLWIRPILYEYEG